MNWRRAGISLTRFLALAIYTVVILIGGMFLASGDTEAGVVGPGDFAFDEQGTDTMEKAVFLKYESFGLNVTEVYTDSHEDFLICLEDRRKQAPMDTIVVQTCTEHSHDGTETRFPQLLREAGLSHEEVMQYADGVRPANTSIDDGDRAE